MAPAHAALRRSRSGRSRSPRPNQCSRPLRLEPDERPRSRRWDGPARSSRGDPEALEVLCGQVDAPALQVLADVAEDVRQLHGHAQVVGQRLVRSGTRRSEHRQRQPPDRARPPAGSTARGRRTSRTVRSSTSMRTPSIRSPNAPIGRGNRSAATPSAARTGSGDVGSDGPQRALDPIQRIAPCSAVGSGPSPTSSIRRAMAYTAASAWRLGRGSSRIPYQKFRARRRVTPSQ